MRGRKGIVIREGYSSQLKDRWLDFGTSVGNKEAGSGVVTVAVG